MTKHQPAVASQRVADILAERILSGRLAPGERIKQDELAEELDTSRIPVRDALRMLEARGLVTMRANAGARVTALTNRDLEISYEIRERIEPLLLAESIPNLTDEDFAEMRAILDRNRTVTDLDEAIALGREFHWVSYRRHDTPLLAQIVERVWDTTQSYRRAYLKLVFKGSSRTHDTEHELMYDAITRREIGTAQAALVMHIRRTRIGLVRYGHLLAEDANGEAALLAGALDLAQ
ncbi:GntR family transcriptional regulator [Novosphingobium sp. PC22D]|uniref:GntR family transcriptional regulator n=1 Tax=Novosphingobium sp. PC22D TaxID=1962403 RepID=UPI000BF02B69|nr:GntR family transcriptional regulator [Novosphingobium sp. PC22D]PEQ12619.1 GntR family transcriptional regulator [Novosphingobium sp. PC22D]